MQQQATPTPDQYRVVLNEEEQYSLLPSYIDNPAGWRDAGFAGEREACLEYIGKHWTDMRPLSLRRQMEAQEARQAQAEPPTRATKAATTRAASTKASTKASAVAKPASKPRSAARSSGKRG